MTKKLAKRNLISFAILAIIMLALCFVNFAVPATNDRFVGFANAIQTDIDINGGYAADYIVNFRESETDKEQAFNETINLIQNKLSVYGYGSAYIAHSGLDSIHIEIPNIKNAEGVLSAIGITGDLYIRGSETTEISDADLTADDITDIVSTHGQISASEYKWGINFVFSDSGKSKIKTMTEAGSGTLYVYVGDDVYTRVSYDSQITNNSIFVYGSTDNQADNDISALNLLIAKQTVGLELVDNKITEIAPVLGENTAMFILIAIAILLVLFVVASFLLFGEFGYLITLSLGFFVALMIFFMQAVPIFTLSFAGVVGAVIGLVVFFVSNLIIFNKIKQGYAEGKKIPLAVKTGFKDSTLTIVDINVLIIIAAVVIALLGGMFASSFAFAIGLASALTLLLTLVFTKLFAKWYLSINSTKAEKLHLTREANINELN